MFFVPQLSELQRVSWESGQMSDPNDAYNTGPVFNQPEGVNPYGDEQTLPFVDLYPQSDGRGGAPAYGTNSDGPQRGSYGAGAYGGSQYPHEQYATPSYQQDPLYGSAPQQYPMAMSPNQQQQWGQYAHAPAEHPQATVVLVLALVGFAGVVVTPFIAWYLGSKAKGEIERGAPYSYSGTLKIGHIIGMVLSILSIVGVALYVVLMILIVVAGMAF